MRVQLKPSAVVGTISAVAGIPYLRRGQVDGRSLLFFGAPGMAGAYLGAALSKLRFQGLDWADGSTLRSIILSQHPVDDATWLGDLARYVASHLALALRRPGASHFDRAWITGGVSGLEGLRLRNTYIFKQTGVPGDG